MSTPSGKTTRSLDENAQNPIEVCVDKLHKSFGDNRVLRGIDLQVHRGELVAIVGGSGCGKSVLLAHLYAHLKPDSGHVWIADHETPGAPLVDVTVLSEAELDRVRIHWAVVFQHNALFSATVFENIALWLREIKRMNEDQIMPIARHVVEAVGLDPDEVLPRQRSDLSGGMAKRVAVARALAMDPMIMFYDEPTTGLDPHHAVLIQDLIDQTHQSPTHSGGRRTTIIVTHDKDLLRRLRPRIVMLNDGVVFFDGPFESFEASTSPIVRPYFELMPGLHKRMFTGNSNENSPTIQ